MTFLKNQATDYYSDAEMYIKDYYSTKAELVEAIANDEVQDTIHEIADSLVDIYYYDIYRWLPEHSEYVDRALDEGLVDSSRASIAEQIQAGQYLYWQEYMSEYIDELKDQWGL